MGMLETHLAQEVKQCWIDPQNLVLDKYLGHGKIKYKPIHHTMFEISEALTCSIALQGTLQLCGQVFWN